jgi:cytochrome c-type biogenesis protein CcsB
MVYFEELFFTLALVIYLIAAVAFFVFVLTKKQQVGKAAVLITIAGFLAHTTALVLRVIESGRLPFSNQFEFANSFTWSIVLCYLLLHFVYRFTSVGTFVVPLAFLMMGYAAMQPKTIKALMPALQSRWLGLHVGTAIISYGSFAVAAGLAVMYLLAERQQQGHLTQASQQGGLGDSHVLPDAEVCDYLNYRLSAFGYLMLTLVIITGAIWAKSAWSRYWGWDPKETWSLITWLIYSAYLHLRFNRGWRGKRAAWFSVIGFACVIFTFIGVNILLPGIHSYR